MFVLLRLRKLDSVPSLKSHSKETALPYQATLTDELTNIQVSNRVRAVNVARCSQALVNLSKQSDL